MRLSEFTSRAIDDAIISAHDMYKHDEPKRVGAIAGLEACRGLEPHQLATLLIAANTAAVNAKRMNNQRMMEAIAFRTEIVWICEVVSVVLENQNLAPLVQYTPQAYHKAAEIIGSTNHLQ